MTISEAEIAAAAPLHPRRFLGRRPVLGSCEKLQADPHFETSCRSMAFYGETGRGRGASHQTGGRDWSPRSSNGTSSGTHPGTDAAPQPRDVD